MGCYGVGRVVDGCSADCIEIEEVEMMPSGMASVHY